MQNTLFENLTEARENIEPRIFRELHRGALEAVRELKLKEVELIKALQEVDENFVYRYLGYNSLFRYCIVALNLTEPQAMTYISVARKSKKLPALQRALNAGEVTVSKVSRVIPVINEQNQNYWIELVQHSSKREVEKQVAKVNPRAVNHEKARFLNETTVELQVPMSEKVFDLLKRAQEIMLQKRSDAVSLEKTIEELCERYLEKHDPLEREKRRQEKHQPRPGEVSGTGITVKSSPVLSQVLKDKVLSRDEARCTYTLNNKRCEARVFLHVHHILPKENGGTNELSNLTTLCSAHHQLVHGRFH